MAARDLTCAIIRDCVGSRVALGSYARRLSHSHDKKIFLLDKLNWDGAFSQESIQFLTDAGFNLSIDLNLARRRATENFPSFYGSLQTD